MAFRLRFAWFLPGSSTRVLPVLVLFCHSAGLRGAAYFARAENPHIAERYRAAGPACCFSAGTLERKQWRPEPFLLPYGISGARGSDSGVRATA